MTNNNPATASLQVIDVAGVDGCRAGWIVAQARIQGTRIGSLQFNLCSNFSDVLQMCPAPSVIAMDIPIGLLSMPRPGGRTCDRNARRWLKRRASSVFSPPSRHILAAKHYNEVRTYGMSRQAFGILPKIREVDQIIIPKLQQRIYESHPELAFAALSSAPMSHNKKTTLGHAERLQAISCSPDPCFQRLHARFNQGLRQFKRSQVATDDLLDAIVLIRSAYRIAIGHATRLPTAPPLDARGLRMEIWF